MLIGMGSMAQRMLSAGMEWLGIEPEERTIRGEGKDIIMNSFCFLITPNTMA